MAGLAVWFAVGVRFAVGAVTVPVVIFILVALAVAGGPFVAFLPVFVGLVGLRPGPFPVFILVGLRGVGALVDDLGVLVHDVVVFPFAVFVVVAFAAFDHGNRREGSFQRLLLHLFALAAGLGVDQDDDRPLLRLRGIALKLLVADAEFLQDPFGDGDLLGEPRLAVRFPMGVAELWHKAFGDQGVEHRVPPGHPAAGDAAIAE